jgi:hypothetical protein
VRASRGVELLRDLLRGAFAPLLVALAERRGEAIFRAFRRFDRLAFRRGELKLQRLNAFPRGFDVALRPLLRASKLVAARRELRLFTRDVLRERVELLSRVGAPPVRGVELALELLLFLQPRRRVASLVRYPLRELRDLELQVVANLLPLLRLARDALVRVLRRALQGLVGRALGVRGGGAKRVLRRRELLRVFPLRVVPYKATSG